ncbi:MAG: four helix bundle protein [Flavobacteriales bacterium]|nr:four helix bundle protein [Flavobacteriales bacterium]|tara:strand:- start:478 stop:858 length:381 start_codon:yes stop_codon:yes gene_type:complete
MIEAVKKHQQFEDLRVWQAAQDLYKRTSKSFKNTKSYFFRDQILKAALSVSNNIAEGFERKSNKEWIYFLYVAKGSCGEVRSMLYLAEDQNMISNTEMEEMKKMAMSLSKMIGALISSSLKNNKEE